MARVLFVLPVPESYGAERPLLNFMQGNAGISLMAGLLKAHGHETEAFVAGHNHMAAGRRLLNLTIARFRPDVVGFSAMAPTFQASVHLARSLRRHHPGLYLVAGGPHVSLNPETTLDAGFDAACVGEGEHPLLELTEQLSRGQRPTSIANFWFRNGTETERNPPRPFLEDLDSLPPADYDVWQKWVDPEMLSLYVKAGMPTVSVLLSRGCPFRCTYCSNHALSRLASGPYVRVRSPDAIVADVRTASQLHPGVHDIYLEVETIGLNQEWALALFERLEAFNAERTSPLRFGCNLRVIPGLQPDALFAAMQTANVRFLNIGLESGSERLRTEVLHRHYSNDDMVRTVAAARRYGLRFTLYNLIGIPGETYEDFLETVRMNRILAPDEHMTSIFEPYPGTELHVVCEERGYLRTVRYDPLGRQRAQLDLPGFSRATIQRCSNWFDYYVFKGRMSNRQLLLRIGTRWFRSSRLLVTVSHWRPLARILRILKSRVRPA
ncbi:MAG TPA: radical SAM protein [Vicinamibacterales bacterium]|jgi:radical SAM superfamily enzyme YgiQ (UPF0313 family)